MKLLWILVILLTLQSSQSGEVVEPGPPAGIALQESPGLLLSNCRIHTQQIYVRLDPWDAYCKHLKLPPQSADGRPNTQTQNRTDHAKVTTIHMLDQL